jgi:hypothetical protein
VSKLARKNSDHMHTLVIALSTVSLFLSFWLFTKTAAEAGSNSKSAVELRASQCDTSGKPVINVSEKIVKTVDSGQGGNNWAFDDVNRQIQVWKNSDNTFCALIQNEGKFDSQDGEKSPGNTGVLSGKEDGSFKGGYRAKITGNLKESPGWKTTGSVGTHYYNCSLDGTCPGYVNWVEQYFSPGYTFGYDWWGWTYRYKNNTWVNSSDGNSGDII